MYERLGVYDEAESEINSYTEKAKDSIKIYLKIMENIYYIG